MRKVLASLKPYYYYLVGEGIKEIEVRKDMPKASDWNKEVLFYMSKDVKSFAKIPKDLQEKYRKHFGKVGLKFICDKIEKFVVGSLACDDVEQKACISYREICDYFYGKNYDNTVRIGYGWHISNLKIYDKPKELSEFSKYGFGEPVPLKRPPQSWMYVEAEAVKALEEGKGK